MKQLLQICGEHIIVGLNDTVYYGSGNAFCELVPFLTPSSSSPPSPTLDDGGGNTHTNKMKKKAVDAVNPHEVQAVAVTTTTGSGGDANAAVWCAVARYDKSLSLYKISENDSGIIGTTTTTTAAAVDGAKSAPRTVHKTAKRVSTLCFATVFGKTSKNSKKQGDDGDHGDGNITVIVSGDLAGDATAFPLELSIAEKVEDTNSKEGDSNREQEHDETANTKNRRLLLGHTASMLTSVHVVETISDPGGHATQQRILTADRDEKIRVSSFPATHCIQGYLLGHEAFVSSVAVSPETGRCASVGGDGTLRLWDFTTCQELAVAAMTTTTSASDASTAAAAAAAAVNEPEEGKIDETAKADEETVAPQPVPSKVAMSANGDIIVTMCDDCVYLDLWKVRSAAAATTVTTSSTNGSAPDAVNDDRQVVQLDRCLRFECATQPLAVSFAGGSDATLLVLLREPEYVLAFTVTHHDEPDGGVSITPLGENHAFCASVGRVAAAKSIVMPDRLLDRDEYGSLKMQKMNEKRSGATLRPWNNAARVETDKERIQRLRKRRRDEYELEKNGPEAEADNSS